MGTSMSDPRAPEANRLYHKINTVRPQEPCQSLDYKVVVSGVSTSRRTVSQDRYRKRARPIINISFVPDPQNNDLEQTPLFSPSFPDNYLQLSNSKIKVSSGSKTNAGQGQTITIQEEDNYQLRPSLVAPRSSVEGVSTYSFLDGNEEEIKLPLNSKIKESQCSELTFSHAIESHEMPGDPQSNHRENNVNCSKIEKMMAKMIKEQNQTSDLLNRYLPKSRVEVWKNVDIKLVVSRTALGKTIGQTDKDRNDQDKIQEREADKKNKVQVYYTNLKRKLNKRKKSMLRLEQTPQTKTVTDQHDYYQLSKNITPKERTASVLGQLRKRPELEKRRLERTQHTRQKLRPGTSVNEIGTIDHPGINIQHL